MRIGEDGIQERDLAIPINEGRHPWPNRIRLLIVECDSPLLEAYWVVFSLFKGIKTQFVLFGDIYSVPSIHFNILYLIRYIPLLLFYLLSNSFIFKQKETWRVGDAVVLICRNVCRFIKKGGRGRVWQFKFIDNGKHAADNRARKESATTFRWISITCWNPVAQIFGCLYTRITLEAAKSYCSVTNSARGCLLVGGTMSSQQNRGPSRDLKLVGASTQNSPNPSRYGYPRCRYRQLLSESLDHTSNQRLLSELFGSDFGHSASLGSLYENIAFKIGCITN